MRKLFLAAVALALAACQDFSTPTPSAPVIREAPTAAQVNEPPDARFTSSCGDPNPYCVFDSSLSTDDVGITAREWRFGDGTTERDVVAPLHFYPAPGNYVVRLAVRDAGGLVDTIARPVTVPSGPGEPPVARFTYQCWDGTCSFDSSASTDDVGITHRAWVFGDGSEGGNEVTISHTYDLSRPGAPGLFNVGLVVTDGGGLSDDAVKQVAPFPHFMNHGGPVASFTYSCTPTRVCTLDASGSTDDVGIVSYEWWWGTNLLGTGMVFSQQFSRSGPHTIKLIATDGAGLTGIVNQTIIVP